jgi:hypothetical protein
MSPCAFNSTIRLGIAVSISRKRPDGSRYSIVRRNRGPKSSSWSGEYDIARVVHVREKKTRLRDVDQLDNIGIAKREASGRDIGARRDDRDIFSETEF